MTTLYLHAGREGPAWQERFERAAPEWRVLAWPAEVDRAEVDFIACWRPPSGFFQGFDALRAVFAFGAGINHLLARPDLPASVPLVRLTDAGMAGGRVPVQVIGQVGELPGLLLDADLAVGGEDGAAGRVVASILEAAQPVDENRYNRLRSDVADDSAHEGSAPLLPVHPTFLVLLAAARHS